MEGAAGGEEAQERRRAGGAGRAVRHARSARAYPVRQWPGIYRDGGAGMAGEGRREDALHRPRIAMGEWILRELQRVAARRTAQWRDLLLTNRRPAPDRRLAAPLQPPPAAPSTDERRAGKKR